MNMKNLSMLVIGVLMLSGMTTYSLSFAESETKNYYAFNEFQILDHKDKEGNVLALQVVTKIFDKDSCEKVINAKSKSMGRWVSTGTFCAKGSDVTAGTSTWDETVDYMFTDQPKETGGLYISLTDLSGFQTRFQFQILSGPKSPVPGFPVDVPPDDVLPLAEGFIKSLETSGVKDARIIFPTKKR